MTVAILNAHDEHCTKGALTGIFGWLLQFILASLAFTCLIAKRYCEPRFERRPWRIWFYDTSKQGLGSLFMHMSNIFISGRFQGDPCTWYIINFLLDSSVGLLIIYIGIRLTQFLQKRKKWSAINFGEYGMPPSTHAWMMQCCLYILLMFVVKVIITLLIQFKFWTKVREFILYPFPNQDVELAVVMLIIPLVVNAMMFWVTDDFLMHRSADKSNRLLQKTKIHYRHVMLPRNESDSDVALTTDEEILEESIRHNQSSVLS
ncbi:LOW QUALITY PROTEIN: store-operated calcium entry regulator STIMATE-like [Homalodisca vitripennis]|uniref:LOW QUALITY PROTEIN: store-operated calcium entry regulator STIMATE-like n=1 Tax=Homalodisca vitripennis TaxID=197043 RepID=UPI001EEAE503|nr:LOW QUALITY PROTEIN: store-operated calcium entry regulator STIMATE-like [Homalodisca vitripennis]